MLQCTMTIPLDGSQPQNPIIFRYAYFTPDILPFNAKIVKDPPTLVAVREWYEHQRTLLSMPDEELLAVLNDGVADEWRKDAAAWRVSAEAYMHEHGPTVERVVVAVQEVG